jgi:hypothetical protein
MEEDDFKDSLDVLLTEESLGEWVWNKNCEWERDYSSNYEKQFKEYYRLWRGIWAPDDRQRDSERSKLISPALQQAVESNVAEIEEATFGRGQWLDLRDETTQDPGAPMKTRDQLLKDFEYCQIRKSVGEVLINAAVFGTGIGELVLETVEVEKMATRPVMDGQLQSYGVEFEERTVVRLDPVLPQNFRIDPAATSIDNALGVAIDKFVGKHRVEELMEDGTYYTKDLDTAASDTDLEADPNLPTTGDSYTDRVRLVKYYGKVPTALLLEYVDKEDLRDPDAMYTEAVVVLANGGDCVLKAEAHPYMFTNDRPVVAFPWDVVPSRFWGRGVCEKGYNVQKALDTEMRARVDALALTVAPMMAMDANKKLPGARYDVRPGKVWLTQGSPQDTFLPLNIGDVKQSSFAQTEILQQMIQQATGAVDSAGITGQVNGEATAAGISMSLGAIIKRHKRTLVNFQQSFLSNFVRKAAYRYMQYDPERYPAKDYQFEITNSLGIIAREWEVGQLTQLLQTTPPDSPIYASLVEAVVEAMSLSNREELIATLRQASQPDPQAQQAQQAAQQAQMEFQQAQTAAVAAEAEKSKAEAEKVKVETQLAPRKLDIDLVRASTTNLDEGSNDEKEFEKRIKVAEFALKEMKVRADIKKSLDKP